jgi:type I restriction enzyme M protein
MLKDELQLHPADLLDTTTRKTERTAVAILMHWMREIIDRQQLDLGLPDVETSGADRKMPDLVIYESRRSQKVLCLIEAKPPYFDVFEETELKEPARRKASRRKAKYFGVLNFTKLIWYDTAKVNELRPEEEQIVDNYTLSELQDLNDLEQIRHAEPLKQRLEVFLKTLYAVHTGTQAEPKHALDEWLIFRLHEKIRVLSFYYRRVIEGRTKTDRDFARKLRLWFADQNWSFAALPDDFDKAARQTAYLLVNKILFYEVLQAKRPAELDPLELPKGLTKGGVLQATLQGYFNHVLRIDYETIFTTDFIDDLAFPNAKEVVREIKELVVALSRYDFSKLGYDVIGRIFERLIPPQERHYLGQYFTPTDVVDLILKFCLRHETEKVLDPSCGAGTFLVRAYQHKKLMNQRLPHDELLTTIWGNDIAKFPAHLATINLAINDLSADINYPNIIHKDFFELSVGDDGFDPENWRKVRARTLGVTEREVIYPRYFDAIVGNPPYTRQEEITKIAPDIGAYKENLITSALQFHGKKIADLSRRAGLHAYFFVHGTKFLRPNGRFGFIVANSWLDVEYGSGLQEFFLQNYKILAIIESKVERWFEQADVNTCIVILERCDDEQERNANLVSFASLQKPLRHFIPPAHDMWEKQVARLTAIENLRRTILGHTDFYENDELRIYPKKQAELFKEGYDAKTATYTGSRWGKYIRAPRVFFSILRKNRNVLVKLQTVAEVRFGIKTGANEFFYLAPDEVERLKIEQEFLRPVIFSLKEVKGYRLDRSKLSNRMIVCHKLKTELKNTHLLAHIKRGEQARYHERPTCASRGADSWYMLAPDWPYAPLIFPAKIGERMPVFLNDNVYEDKKLYGITPFKSEDTKLLAALLNSTLSRFFVEFSARQLTGSQAIADIDVTVVESLFIVHPDNISEKQRVELISAFERLAETKADSLFHEIAATPEAVALDKIKPERRAIDSIIMADILGMTEEEQLEVYRAVIDVIKSRLDKAQTFGVRPARKRTSVNIELLVRTVVERIRSEK